MAIHEIRMAAEPTRGGSRHQRRRHATAGARCPTATHRYLGVRATCVRLAAQLADSLTGVDPARHPEDQEPHSFGAHRADVVARLVITPGMRRARPSRGDAWRFPPADFRHTT